jgi:hypothetical protein
MTTAPHSDLLEAPPANVAGDSPLPAPLPPPRRSWLWLGIAGWVAAAALAVAVGTFWETILRLRYEIQVRDERVSELSHRVTRDQRWYSVVSAPGAHLVELRPVAATTLRGRAVYDPISQRALVVFQDAVPPQGSDYQLWAVRGGIPMDLGILRPDSTGFAIYRLENMGAPGITEAFLVSMETKGGSPRRVSPAGTTILQGSLEK